MRTVRCSSHLGWGGGSLPGRGDVCLAGKGCLPGGRCLPGRGCTPPPCGQTDTCENITFPQLLLRTVKISPYCFSHLRQQRRCVLVKIKEVCLCTHYWVTFFTETVGSRMLSIYSANVLLIRFLKISLVFFFREKMAMRSRPLFLLTSEATVS